MASLGIRCGVNPRLIPNASSSFCTDRSTQICRFISRSSSILNHATKKSTQQIFASMALSSNPISWPHGNNFEPHCKIIEENDKVHSEPMFSEKLDEWMRDSVVEIVKNLKQAPLLVQIYADNNDGSMKVETEKAIPENWGKVNREWTDGEKPSPDGVILVEELEDKNDLEGEIEDEVEVEETKAWGVVIQGKGMEKERGPACYLLKTSRVGSGLGLFCTHFCLVRVKNFRETAASQFKDCWLVQ